MISGLYNYTVTILSSKRESIVTSFYIEAESEIVEFLSANGGRPTTPKVLVVVTDENFTQFVNISGIDTLIIISIGNYADK